MTNVRKLLSANRTLAELGRNPITELVKLADDSKSPTFKRAIWTDIMTYCEAKQIDPVRYAPEIPAESVEAARAIQAKLAEASAPLDPK